MATLINGDGNAAVYAAQDADWFAGVEGNVTKILNIGLKMAYEIEDANTIAVKNGVIVTQEGRRIQIDAGSIDEFTIPTGTQGVTKYYIIGYHLYTDASSNQLCETFVQLMANATDTIAEDTFRGGSDEVYVSLYRVTQDGITLSTVQSLLPEAATIKDIEDDIGTINASLTELLEVTTLQTDTWGQVATKIYAVLSDITMTRPPRLELITYDNTRRLFDVSTYGAHYLHAISSETINDGTQNVLRMFDFNITSSPAFRSVLIVNSSTSISDRTNTTAGVVKAKVYY